MTLVSVPGITCNIGPAPDETDKKLISFKIGRLYIAACKELAHFISYSIPVKQPGGSTSTARWELTI
jgi:hypothetical protein